MERHEVLEMMSALELSGMRAAFDEIVAHGLERRHPVQQIIGELLTAEIADKKARSIKYQMTIAKLPMAKELSDFDFSATPVNEALVRELTTGAFLESKRNVVLVAEPAPAKATSRWRSPARVSETACVRAATMWWSWSTTARRRRVRVVKGAPPSSSPGATWWCWTNSGTCPSHTTAVSCCSI